MKDFSINKRLQRVFVLQETETRLVYIPVKLIDITDYKRLVEIEKKAGNRPLLEVLKDEKLDNGLNALALYENVIQVADKEGTSLVRVQKPTERALVGQVNLIQSEAAQETLKESKTEAPSQKKEESKFKFKLVQDGKEYFWSGLGNPCKEIREYLANGGTKESIAI